MSALSRPEFHSEEAAFAHLEKIIWDDAPVCVHCGGVDRITKVKANPAKRIRVGLWRCGDCKKQSPQRHRPTRMRLAGFALTFVIRSTPPQ